MAFENMEEVITDAVDDFVADEASTVEDTTVETPTVEAAGSVDVELPDSTSEPEADAGQMDLPTAPGVVQPKPAEDDFAKKFGIAAQSVTGRENKIPYSRVKKIVTKAALDARAEAKKEYETEFQPRLTEYETKVKDYEGRLTKVAEFESILENDPRTFLSMLSQVPAYKEFFDYVNKLAGTPEPTKADPQTTRPTGVVEDDPRPGPNKTNPDGSKVYDMEGFNQVLEWQARQVEKKVAAQVSERYAPIEQEWKRRAYMEQTVIPAVDRQLAEARTWDRFEELEPKVTEILKADPRITLERAYMKAYQSEVVPKMMSDKNKMRTEVLAELKRQPVTTAAPTTRTSPRQPQDNTNRTIEEIIASEVAKAGG